MKNLSRLAVLSLGAVMILGMFGVLHTAQAAKDNSVAPLQSVQSSDATGSTKVNDTDTNTNTTRTATPSIKSTKTSTANFLPTGVVAASDVSAGSFGANTGGGTYSFPGILSVGTRIEFPAISTNLFIGNDSGSRITTAFSNVIVGQVAGEALTSGGANVMLGYNAGGNDTTGFRNVFIGSVAGLNNTTGAHNVFMGDATGFRNTTGTNNTFLGDNAGLRNETGSGNVFIGNSAGARETGSNQLFIANTDTATPLIYGDFSTGWVGIGTRNPQSALDVPQGSYAQFENTTVGAPPAMDCNSDMQRGRISIDREQNRLYVCNGSKRGWDYAQLND